MSEHVFKAGIIGKRVKSGSDSMDVDYPDDDHNEPDRKQFKKIYDSSGSSEINVGDISSYMDESFREDSTKQVIIRKWKANENEKLLEGVQIYGSEDKWDDISQFIRTRNAQHCLYRWEKLRLPDPLKGQWSAPEDQKLLSILLNNHESWGSVADLMPGRNAKQCRERWCHHLSPDVKKTPFTLEEDQKLLSLYITHGNKWAKIASLLPGRTENLVRSRLIALNKMDVDSKSLTQ